MLRSETPSSDGAGRRRDWTGGTHKQEENVTSNYVAIDTDSNPDRREKGWITVDDGRRTDGDRGRRYESRAQFAVHALTGLAYQVDELVAG